jgi:hypothetical protein
MAGAGQAHQAMAVNAGMTLSLPPIPQPPNGTDSRFDRPPRAPAAERRLAMRVLAEWQAGNGGPVTGHDDNALLVADPAGAPVLQQVGAALAKAFGLHPGQRLVRAPGMAAELLAACEILCLHPVPLPFEAIVPAPLHGDVLLRGVALPIAMGDEPFGQVQIICNWRQLLSRSATARLRRELGAALRQGRASAPALDPFALPPVLPD